MPFVNPIREWGGCVGGTFFIYPRRKDLDKKCLFLGWTPILATWRGFPKILLPVTANKPDFFYVIFFLSNEAICKRLELYISRNDRATSTLKVQKKIFLTLWNVCTRKAHWLKLLSRKVQCSWIIEVNWISTHNIFSF